MANAQARAPRRAMDDLWRPFAVAALATGLAAGFGTGVALAAAPLLGAPAGLWYAALAQAHGQAQLFGLAGLLAFGVAFHFLPRLRGTALWGAAAARWVLWLYGGGVLARVVAQWLPPFNLPQGWLAARLLLALSGPLTLGGAALGVALLAQTFRRGPPLRSRAGVRQVLPLLAAAWAAFLAALAINAAGTVTAVLAGAPDGGPPAPLVPLVPLVPPGLDALVVRLALIGWLLPLAVAFSARTFPLFIWTRAAPGPALWWGLAGLEAGLLAEVAAAVAPGWEQALLGVGRGVEGAALLWLVRALGVLGPKRRPPGTQRDPAEARLARASVWALVGAYLWLVVAAALMLAQLLTPLVGLLPPPEDGQRHALGAGFTLLLIVGMALRLLPGFAAGKTRPVGLPAAVAAIWATHAAALLRAGPPLLSWLLALAGGGAEMPGRVLSLAVALAGVAGATALVALAVALRGPLSRPA